LPCNWKALNATTINHKSPDPKTINNIDKKNSFAVCCLQEYKRAMSSLGGRKAGRVVKPKLGSVNINCNGFDIKETKHAVVGIVGKMELDFKA